MTFNLTIDRYANRSISVFSSGKNDILITNADLSEVFRTSMVLFTASFYIFINGYTGILFRSVISVILV